MGHGLSIVCQVTEHRITSLLFRSHIITPHHITSHLILYHMRHQILSHHQSHITSHHGPHHITHHHLSNHVTLHRIHMTWRDTWPDTTSHNITWQRIITWHDVSQPTTLPVLTSPHIHTQNIISRHIRAVHIICTIAPRNTTSHHPHILSRYIIIFSLANEFFPPATSAPGSRANCGGFRISTWNERAKCRQRR